MAPRIFGRHNAGLKTTTKRELLKLLDCYSDDQLIALAYNYGDYSRTVAVDGIEGAELVNLTETSYSPSGFAVASAEAVERDDVFVVGDGEASEPLSVVVLS